jgi:hypothetical protein
MVVVVIAKVAVGIVMIMLMSIEMAINTANTVDMIMMITGEEVIAEDAEAGIIVVKQALAVMVVVMMKAVIFIRQRSLYFPSFQQ